VTGVQFVRAPGGGKSLYWYLEYRAGEHIKRRYLGPDTEELRARIDVQRNSMADRKADAAQKKQLVAAACAAHGILAFLSPSLADQSWSVPEYTIFTRGVTLQSNS
jgi:hypothetical protein